MGLGGARKVTSVDISQSSIDQANKNWKYNKLTPSHHEGLCTDAYDFILNTQKSWDLIVVDPPSMTQSEKTKPSAIKKYTHLFSSAAAKVRPGGHLCLSSCSSHINFDDFFQIITDSLSQCHRRGQIMRVSGQGPDHPFPHICHHFRYLKFVHLILS